MKNNYTDANRKFDIKLDAWHSVSYDIREKNKIFIKGLLSRNLFRYKTVSEFYVFVLVHYQYSICYLSFILT